MQSQVKARETTGKNRERRIKRRANEDDKGWGTENCKLPVHQVENIEPGDENWGTVRFLRLASNEVDLRVCV